MSTRINHLPIEIIVDDHIILRLKTPESYEIFAEVVGSQKHHLLPWLPWAQNAPDQSSIDHYFQAAQKRDDNVSVDWDIFVDDTYAGAVSVLNRTPESVHPEIGYWLIDTFTGRGIMTTCVRALTNIVFTQTDADAIEIAYDPRNANSKSVAERSGFTFHHEGQCTPSGASQPGDAHFNQLTRDEWSQNVS